MDSPEYDTEFSIGDRVEKVAGYEYPGVIVSVFQTLRGNTRYVVEHCYSKGMLHIFSEAQLRYAQES